MVIADRDSIAGPLTTSLEGPATDRKASLLIDTAHAFFQWGRYEDAYAALRAADQAAPEEVAARPSVSALARDLAASALAGIRRDAGEFASRLGTSW